MTRSKSLVLSQEPFRKAISAEGKDHAEPAEALSDDGTLHRKLDAIGGLFPTLHEAEELLISTALQAAKGNQGIAATMLGLKRQTLNMRLKVKKEST